MARSKTATAEAIFWQAIEAFALRARTTSLDPRSRPENVALIRTNRSTFGVGPISINCPTSSSALAYGPHPMSALGQKQTFKPHKVMSALPPKAYAHRIHLI